MTPSSEANFRWRMYVQIMTEEQANAHKDNPFDLTKVWYQATIRSTK